jgi:hypothetical protein
MGANEIGTNGMGTNGMGLNEISLPDKFISQENKRLLWGIMVEHNVFDAIPNKYANNIKADFEKKLQGIKSLIARSDNILDLNKKTILQMMEEVKKYRETPIAAAPATQYMPVTSAEVQTKKQAQFQQGLQTKQEEFNRLIQPVKPQTIDFADKIDDEPIGSEMDIKLSQTIAWREQQLSQVLEKQNPVEANDWINNGKKVSGTANAYANSTTNANNANNTKPIINSTNHIKIGDPTNIDESSFINLKKVSFAEDNNNNINDKGTNNKSSIPFNFMDKLKKKEGTDDNSKLEMDLLKAELTNINSELTDVKAELTGVKAELTDVKAELTDVKADISKLLLDNKLILENQEKIMDKLEQIAFQTGII